MRIIKSALVVVYTSTIAFASATGFNIYTEEDDPGPVAGIRRTFSFADWREKGIARDAEQNLLYNAEGQPIVFEEGPLEFFNRMVARQAPIVNQGANQGGIVQQFATLSLTDT